MPFAVWLDLTAPEAAISDEQTTAQMPDLISDLIAAGWEVVGPVVDSDDDDGIDHEDEGPPDLLDVRVLSYPSGAFIGLAIDTGQVDIALAIGTGLARHLVNAAPALMGWTLDSIRADKLIKPDADGEWLPGRDEPRPHFPIAVYLPTELQDLCARYLLAGAVRHLVEPTARSPHAANAADVIAGAAIEHPWGRELASELGHLLIAAGHVEDEYGVQSTLASRGDGDPGLAQDLLDLVRREIATPFTGYDDDQMRGHVVLEQFMEQHDLTWNRVNSDLDEEARERHSRRQLRTLLWAGLRALTTLTSAVHDQSNTPWLLLSAVDDDDPVVDLFAEDDQSHLDATEVDALRQVTAAARAHLWARIAIVHPALLGSAAPELARLSLDHVRAIGPLHHLLGELLPSFGIDTIKALLSTEPPPETAAIATALLPVLANLDNEEIDAFNDMYHAIDELVPVDDDATEQVHQMLLFLSRAAQSVGSDRAREIAGYLLRSPSESACVLVTGDDRDTDPYLWHHLLAQACTISTQVAADIAQQLPQLSSHDPRAEPALRHEATTWWSRLVALADDSELDTIIRTAAARHVEHEADLISILAASRQPSLPEAMPTAELVAAIIHTVSTLSLAADEPALSFQTILGNESISDFSEDDEEFD